MDSKCSAFKWQDGYGSFSIYSENIDDVANYIRNQHKHHEKISFKEEYRAILKKNNIEFDERYVWD